MTLTQICKTQRKHVGIIGVIITICICSFLLTGCQTASAKNKDEPPLAVDYVSKDNWTEGRFFALDTFIQVRVYDMSEEKAKSAIHQAVLSTQAFEGNLSKHKDSSDVHKININAGKEATKVSEDVLGLVESSIYYHDLTGGLFDISLEPVISLWGIGTDRAEVPERTLLDEKLSLVGIENIEIDKANQTIRLKSQGQGIDLGGIGKGYIADEIKNKLKENEVDSAFINLGGNALVIGTKPDGSNWNIGIQDPTSERGDYLGIVSIKDKTVVTSGSYERFFEAFGQRYHHIIDPVTGMPVTNQLLSVSIISDSSMDSDALSTSVYLMGLEKGLDFINNLENVEAIFVTDERKVYCSKNIDLSLTNDSFEMIYK